VIDSPRPDGSRAPALGGEPELVKFLIENFELIFSENDVLGRETMDLMATLAMMDGTETGNACRRTLVMLKPTPTDACTDAPKSPSATPARAQYNLVPFLGSNLHPMGDSKVSMSRRTERQSLMWLPQKEGEGVDYDL